MFCGCGIGGIFMDPAVLSTSAESLRALEACSAEVVPS